MKKILFISLLVLVTGTISYALENTSLRVKGMHEDLANLIEDEYTDFMFLPHNMLDVEGYRLYN